MSQILCFCPRQLHCGQLYYYCSHTNLFSIKIFPPQGLQSYPPTYPANMYSFTYSEMTCKYSRCEGKCASLYMQVSYRSVSLQPEVISQQHCVFCSMKDTVAWVLLLLQLHLSLTFEAIYTHVHKDGLLLTPLMIIANIYSSWCKSHTLAMVVSLSIQPSWCCLSTDCRFSKCIIAQAVFP